MEKPFINSLGMKFVPVPITGGLTGRQRVLFSVWKTRVQDYDVFAVLTKRPWPRPNFPQGSAHPAVNVSWNDAKAFCVWLTNKQRAAGELGVNQEYRLPSDHEWSCAVGIGDREDPKVSPKDKDRMTIANVYPWGSVWPPPNGVGNYHPSLNVDSYEFTSPVGSFYSNGLGIYDLGGNVWDWCEDLIEPLSTMHVLRGATYRLSDHFDLLSSNRGYDTPGDIDEYIGFRCVLGDCPLPF